MSAQALRACGKIVETATRACTPSPTSTPVIPPSLGQPDWDAMAASFASLSNAFAWGSVILAILAIFAGVAWGKIVTATAEREAKEMAKTCAEEIAKARAEEQVKRWLEEVAPPLIKREAVEFLRAFRGESPISDDELADLVSALGSDEKEGENGQK